MQVSSVNEFVTHAVISNKQAIEFGISNSAEFFNILSSTLYKDQILAVVRETLCNAWDAHIEAGCTDRPVQITLDGDMFIIKDFGKGIHHDDMGIIYGTYGNSTKKNDGMQTGGFGLGCKAPFAYTDHFEVTSSHAGVKTIYNLSKSSAQAQGKPGIIPIATFPTEETGLTVSIRVQPRDVGRFKILIKRIVQNGDMNMTLNGKVLPVLGFDASKGNYLITNESGLLDTGSDIMVRYGNVIYPVDTASAVGHQYKAILSHLKKMGWNYRIVFQAPPHSISVTPSRESLSMQEHTVKTLLSLFNGFLDTLKGDFIEACDAYATTVVGEAVKLKRIGSLLNKDPKLPCIQSNEDVSNISDLCTMAKVYMRSNYPEGLAYRKADITNRLNQMVQHNLLDRGKVQTFLLALKDVKKEPKEHWYRYSDHEDNNWLQRRVIAPLISKLNKSGLDPKKLFVCDYEDRNLVKSSKDSVPPLVPASNARPTHLFGALPYLRNIIVITTRRDDLVSRVRDAAITKNLGHYCGYLVYVAGRKKGEVEGVSKFFAGSGMRVVDLTEAAEVPVRTRSTTPRKPTKKGLVCLSSILNEGVIDTHRSRYDNAPRIEAPEFVVQISMRQDAPSDRIEGWNREQSRFLVELFGDKGGITNNVATKAKWISQGAKEFEDYVREKVCAYILFNPRIQEFQSQLASLAEEGISGYHEQKLIRLIYATPDLMKEFGLVSMDSLTDLDKKYLSLWERYQDMYSYNPIPEVNQVKEWLASIPLDSAVNTLTLKIADNPLVPLISIDEVRSAIKHKDTTVSKKALDFIISIING